MTSFFFFFGWTKAILPSYVVVVVATTKKRNVYFVGFHWSIKKGRGLCNQGMQNETLLQLVLVANALNSLETFITYSHQEWLMRFYKHCVKHLWKKEREREKEKASMCKWRRGGTRKETKKKVDFQVFLLLIRLLTTVAFFSWRLVTLNQGQRDRWGSCDMVVRL